MSNNDKKQEDQKHMNHGSVVIQHDFFPATTITMTSGPILVNPVYLHADIHERSAPFIFNLSGEEYLPARQLAALFELPYDSLRRRLERLRNSPSGGVIQVENQSQKQPTYLYQLRAVLPEIEALQCGKNVHRNKLCKQMLREKVKKDPQIVENASIDLTTTKLRGRFHVTTRDTSRKGSHGNRHLPRQVDTAVKSPRTGVRPVSA